MESDDRSGTFRYLHAPCKTSPLIHNARTVWGPERSIELTLNVLHVPLLCKKTCVGEIESRLGYCFLQQLGDIARNDKGASKLTLQTHSDLSRLKGRPHKIIFQIDTLYLHKINERLSLQLTYCCFLCY